MKRPSSLLGVLAWIGFASCASAAPATSQATPPQSHATVRLGEDAERVDSTEFFPGAVYEERIATPASQLGFELGRRPAHHAQVLACWRTWEAQSDRVKLEVYGHTHEGRELLTGVITAPENLARLDGILADVAQLADPRGVSDAQRDQITARSPAVAWLAYSIHGDEMSGVDGGLALAHHLIASRDEDVRELLRNVVVVFDPIQNPDGRERFLSMLEQMAGSTPVLDGEALSHGRWPRGRGNHYLFDMNRDWIAGVAPETRGRWAAVQRFHPQLFVDAHEMGRDDSYLFYPQADPLNPNLPRQLVAWQTRYASEIASAFDRYGWSYYTREWADGWGPFYSDSWGSLNGAVGILYEQARYDGQSVKLASGEVATYAQAAHRQAIASWSNLRTLAANRQEALRAYAEQRKFDAGGGASTRRTFVVRTSAQRSRTRWLVDTLRAQGIEVRATERAKLSKAEPVDGIARDSVVLDGELYVVEGAQPQGALVRAFLDFDTRYPKADLERERRELELKNSSKIYDVTAWDFSHALDLDAWWCDSAEYTARATDFNEAAAGLVAAADPAAPTYGWLIDGADDGAPKFAAAALESGLVVSLSDEAFESAGRLFARGSLLVRRHENDSAVVEKVQRAALRANVRAFAATTARAPGAGHDLGGQHFQLLERPRVALVSNSPVSVDQFGHLWQALDRELGLPVSLLDAQELGDYDLRRYNVIVLPSGGGIGAVVDGVAEELGAWIRGGGTLIAIGASAAALCDAERELSSVRQRADVLETLDEYLFAAKRERAAALLTPIDEDAVWNGSKRPATPNAAGGDVDDDVDVDVDKPAHDVDPDAEREEQWRQRFAPQGVFLRTTVRTDLWITSGAGAALPVFFDGTNSLWSRSPVTTAVRFESADKLRASGLLWPEARERLADSAYLTVESLGNGQLILFASQPGFRGYHRATGRLFANAVVYGPGAGARPLRGR